MDEEPTAKKAEAKPQWVFDLTGFDWAGLSVFVLALGVSVALVIGMLIPLFQGQQMSTGLGNILSSGVGASIGALATYVGMRAQKSRQE